MSNKFGRVDEANNVFVIEAGSERKVGQYPNVSADEALAYYEKKYADLESQVRILEQRVKAKADANSLNKNITKLQADLVEPAAVGDIQSLRDRVTALTPSIDAIAVEKTEHNKEQIAEALAKRTEIAVQAEAIANQDAAKVQWKKSAAEMTALFEAWQQLQKSGARVAKADADPIWKRFSASRTKFESAKRQYFAALDTTSKAAKAQKLKIVEAATTLAEKGSGSVAEYRKLLDQWKLVGRTNPKTDDELWAKFKAAGDKIYAAKSEAVAVSNSEYEANLKLKQELIKEASASVKPEENLEEAKKALLSIQARWEKIGKVSKEKVREVEDKIRAIETKVRKAEEEHWRKSDPATQDRTNSVLTQLHESIAKLEDDLKSAQASKDAKKIASATEALDARKAWLEVVKASSN